MKSERRHELQHNQLADTLGRWVVKLKPHAQLIAGVVVLLLVLGLAYAYVNGKSEASAAAGWDQYFEALDANDRGRLTEITEKFPGTSVAIWSRVVAADMALSDGCLALFSNKAEGRDLLRQAINNYQTVLNETTDDTLTQRALYGLGRGHEALASLDDLKKARADYQKLFDGWPDGVYAEVAKQRLRDLARPATKEFYDWFARHEPPAKVSPSGKKPEFLEESLNQDIRLPSAFDDLRIDGPALKGDEPAEEPLLPGDAPSETKSQEPPAEAAPPTEAPPPAEGSEAVSPETPLEKSGDQAEP